MNRPKRDNKNIKLSNKAFGKETRVNYYKEITEKAPIFPKALELDDIDNSFMNFVKEQISLSYNGTEVPTFSIYSNQRFSEYSQTWEHTDDKGNLLMNFKTIMRDKTPKNGTIHGVKYNIPGDRKYTLLIRDVLNDNGTESYEIYSMKQPYSVDLQYKVSFITNKFELINNFTQIVNKLFCSRQCYIRPNGHYIPMVLENISDESEYNLESRKFYSISCDIKVMAYIIHQEDFQKEIKPKKYSISFGDRKKPKVEIEESELNESNQLQSIEVNISFTPFKSKTTFVIDVDANIENIQLENIRKYNIWVNSIPLYTEGGFNLSENDEITILVKPIDIYKNSSLKLIGYKQVILTPEDIVNESVKDSFEEIDSIQIQ